MKIIDSEIEFDSFCREIQKSNLLIVPVFCNSNQHYRLQTATVVWVHVIQTKMDYILTLDHSESLYQIDSLLLFNKLNDNKNYKFIINYKDLIKKYIANTNYLDIELLQYLDNGSKLILPQFKLESYFKNIYPKYSKINSLIPICKYIEYFESIKPTLLNVISQYNPLDTAYKYYNETVIPSISILESNALKVNLDDIPKNVIKVINTNKELGLMYSQYNIFTTTGRPSNRFNTINFAALNKESGIRKMFVSRFEKGGLLEFDFESYHLRIIANLIDYKLPAESAHEYFGKLYFNKTELTESEYEESKQINFRQLYGGILPEYEHIDFFRKTKDYINILWDSWKNKGYIESPISGRRLYKKNFPPLNAQKLFNYLIQLLETEINFKKIFEINQYLEDNQCSTKMVLYTYDSFLFDFDFGDGKKCINGIKKILQKDNFVVRKYVGSNYNEMSEIKK